MILKKSFIFKMNKSQERIVPFTFLPNSLNYFSIRLVDSFRHLKNKVLRVKLPRIKIFLNVAALSLQSASFVVYGMPNVGSKVKNYIKILIF